MKSAAQRTETYISGITDVPLSSGSQGSQVIATDLPFWVLRDFGTSVMKRAQISTTGAGNEIAEMYPKHKKVLKTLSMTLDYLMRRHGIIENGRSKKNMAENMPRSKLLLNIFLFSIPDDRFDLITLGGNETRPYTFETDPSQKLGKREKNARK